MPDSFVFLRKLVILSDTRECLQLTSETSRKRALLNTNEHRPWLRTCCPDFLAVR